MNIGISNVEPIIRCVLKHIASLEVKELLHTAALVRMLTEMKALAYQLICEGVTTTSLQADNSQDVQCLLYLQDHGCYCMLLLV